MTELMRRLEFEFDNKGKKISVLIWGKYLMVRPLEM